MRVGRAPRARPRSRAARPRARRAARRSAGARRSRKPVSMRPARKSACSQHARRAGRGWSATPWSSRGRQRGREPLRRGLARGRPRDHLGEHRVVERADDRAVGVAGVDAHAVGARERGTGASVPLAGQEAGGDVLGVEARLDRVTRDRWRRRTVGRQRLALRDRELQRDEVEPGDQLGDRVLDLQPGVHLEEQELARRRPHELDRARAHVADRLRRGDRGVAQRGRAARRRRAGDGASSMIFWWRRWIEHSRSNRWTTDAVRVAEDLHLDVARVARRIARGTRCRRRTRTRPRVARDVDRVGELVRPSRPRACRGRRRRTRPSPAPGSRSRPRPRRAPSRSSPASTVDAGQHRHAGRGHEPLRLELRAHRSIACGGGPDERSGRPSAHARANAGVLRQEPVARDAPRRRRCAAPRRRSGRPRR